MKTYSRNDFIKFFTDRVKAKKNSSVRPPYNIEFDLFEQNCPECTGQCVSVCEEQIIEISEDGIPFLNFNKGGCTFCEACLEACEKDVLIAPEENKILANIHLDFTTCLAWNSTTCQSCKDACDYNAIFFEGLRNPNIRKDNCTNCGFCVNICPANSIEIKP